MRLETVKPHSPSLKIGKPHARKKTEEEHPRDESAAKAEEVGN